MSDTLRVLSIDDDAMVHRVITRELASSYEVITCNNGLDGIDKAVEMIPDIILLDVEMPGMNGYETCDKLKHNHLTKHIPVIFLSSLSNLRSRLLGYEVGAVDFLIKPFEGGELRAKVDSISEITQKNLLLKGQVEQAKNTAFSAMTDSSKLAMCIKFIESIYSIKDFDSLAKDFFQVSTSLELNCTLMFVIADKQLFYTCTGQMCGALEKDVISTIYKNGRRFMDFGCRTQITYPQVALLIKNMPLEDQTAYGRFKDFFPSMLSATNEKVKQMQTELNINVQTKQVSKAFGAVEETLTNFISSLEENQGAVVNLLQNMIEELELKLPSMGLEEDQEASLVKLIDGNVVAAQHLVDRKKDSADAFNHVIELLHNIGSQQTKLNEEINQPSVHTEADDNEGHLSDDVELF